MANVLIIIKQLITFKFHVQHVNFKLTPKKLHNLQNRQVTCKTRTAPGINVSRVVQSKNVTYFIIGFSVISLTISKLMLQICLESMQQTELRLECFIITGRRSKVSPIVSPKKQLRSCHVTRRNSKLNSSSWTYLFDKMKSFDYKNPK